MKTQDLRGTQIKVGDRVRLYCDSGYTACRSNPKEGSKYECSGVVDAIENPRTNSHSIYVVWDNGESNTYVSRELIAKDSEFISIWDNHWSENPLEQ